ncbi:MAG: ABC transporter substrate-binding protein [Calditrichaeota bacterium]|nr:ABC transporter substrate-binding protein [Calditrichota bacterium]
MNFPQRFFYLSVLVVLFLGCSKERARRPANAASPGGTVKISTSVETETLDPQKILFLSDLQIASHIYEGLVGIDDNQNPFPLIAKNWEKLDNGRRIRFRLRKNVRFQDDPCFPGGVGRPLTASDVLFTFERLADPAVKCPSWYLFAGKIIGMDAFHAGKSSSISGIRVLAPDEVEFHLTKAYFSFLKLLATLPAQIVPREAVAAYGATFGRHPVGTGPFRLVSWKPLREVLLVRNDHYWQTDSKGNRLPCIEALQIKLISNPVLRKSEFLKGNLDLLTVREKDFVELRNQPDFGSKFRVARKIANLGVRFFGFSMDKKTPLSRNPRLRQAVVRAFQREKINESNPLPLTPARSFVPPLLLNGHTFSWYPYTPKAARKIVREMGPAIQNYTLKISSNINTPEVDVLCQAIQDLGLHCKVKIQPVKYYAHILNDRPDIFRVSFVPSYSDPEDYYALFYSQNTGSTNLTGFKNPQFDAFLEQVFFEQNSDKRQELFFQMEKILAQEVPAIYLLQTPPNYVLISRKLRGVTMQMTGTDFRRVWIER